MFVGETLSCCMSWTKKIEGLSSRKQYLKQRKAEMRSCWNGKCGVNKNQVHQPRAHQRHFWLSLFTTERRRLTPLCILCVFTVSAWRWGQICISDDFSQHHTRLALQRLALRHNGDTCGHWAGVATPARRWWVTPDLWQRDSALPDPRSRDPVVARPQVTCHAGQPSRRKWQGVMGRLFVRIRHEEKNGWIRVWENSSSTVDLYFTWWPSVGKERDRERGLGEKKREFFNCPSRSDSHLSLRWYWEITATKSASIVDPFYDLQPTFGSKPTGVAAHRFRRPSRNPKLGVLILCRVTPKTETGNVE